MDIKYVARSTAHDGSKNLFNTHKLFATLDGKFNSEVQHPLM